MWWVGRVQHCRYKIWFMKKRLDCPLVKGEFSDMFKLDPVTLQRKNFGKHNSKRSPIWRSRNQGVKTKSAQKPENKQRYESHRRMFMSYFTPKCKKNCTYFKRPICMNLYKVNHSETIFIKKHEWNLTPYPASNSNMKGAKANRTKTYEIGRTN